MTDFNKIFDMSRVKIWPKWKCWLWPLLMPWRYNQIYADGKLEGVFKR